MTPLEAKFIKAVALGLLSSGHFPNIPLPTMGGHVWWITLNSSGGYKLQQNHITGHYRVLDSNDIRIAWGLGRELENFFDRITKD